MTAAGLSKLEVSDEQIWDIVFPWVHGLFNQYVPYVVREIIDWNTVDRNRIIGNRTLLLTSDKAVLGVYEVAPNIGSYVIYTRNMPLMNMSFDFNFVDTISQWATGTSIRSMSYIANNNLWTYEPPNKLVFFTDPATLSPFVVEYALEHAYDLSTIRPSLKHLVLKASLAAFKRSLGNVRSKFQIFETPFGQLNVNIDIKSEGEQEWREVEDELKTLPPPVPVIIG